MTFTVCYPSGKTFEVSGELGHVLVYSKRGLFAPVVFEALDDGAPGRCAILDPRAVVTDVNGQIVFEGCTTEQLDRAQEECEVNPYIASDLILAKVDLVEAETARLHQKIAEIERTRGVEPMASKCYGMGKSASKSQTKAPGKGGKTY